MTRIEFVYFDLGNILVAFDTERACENVADLAGVTVEEARQGVYESGLEEQYETGLLDSDAFVRAVRERMGLDEQRLPGDRLLDAIADMFTPIDSMVVVAKLARENAGRIGVLSNTCPAHWNWVRRQPWAVSMIDFDVHVLSYQVGAMKPDPAIYEAAEKQAQVSAEQILFIDDKLENVEAAKQRGWQAEQCVGGDQAKSVIKRWFAVEPTKTRSG